MVSVHGEKGASKSDKEESSLRRAMYVSSSFLSVPYSARPFHQSPCVVKNRMGNVHELFTLE